MSVQHEEREAAVPPAPARTIKVLIVEDHTVVAEGLRSLLDQEDRIDVVGIAATVDDAGRAGATARPDILLVDFRLPDGNGAEAGGRVDVTSAPGRDTTVRLWVPRKEEGREVGTWARTPATCRCSTPTAG